MKCRRKILDKEFELEINENKSYGIFISGGLDSLTLLDWLTKDFPFIKDNLTPFSINKEELSFAKNILQKYQLIEKWKVVEYIGQKVTAANVLKENTQIDQFLAAVTCLPPVNLNFVGPKPVRTDNAGARIQLPFLNVDKRYTIALAVDLKTPIEMSHTCTVFKKSHCGKCFMCQERKWAFAAIGLNDPAVYRDFDAVTP